MAEEEVESSSVRVRIRSRKAVVGMVEPDHRNTVEDHIGTTTTNPMAIPTGTIIPTSPKRTNTTTSRRPQYPNLLLEELDGGWITCPIGSAMHCVVI